MSAVLAPRFAPTPVNQEDLARADMYALIARLFYAPDAQLLGAIAQADEIVAQGDNAHLAQAWRALVAAAAAGPETVKEEHENLFIGVGKPDVMLYGSYYLAGFLMEKPLAKLRDDLSKLGLARNDYVSEPEDHLSALCDVMRYLISGDEMHAAASIEEQKQFFSRHLQPWYERFCAAVLAAEKANFYKPAARFVKAFFEIEMESFAMVF
ncbi:MAG: TorD/DmsD family molecular chaperone [Burkholderiales bacterium]